jgi:hypothetical protein
MPSEWAWIGTKFDAVIDNNADGLDPLFAQPTQKSGSRSPGPDQVRSVF